MTPKFLLFIAFSAAPLLVACGPRHEHLSETLIYGGQPVETDAWLGVVAITRRSGNVDTITCTGTLIGPKHVLTAGHCLDDKALRDNDPTALSTLGVLIGSGKEGGTVERSGTIKAVVVSESLRLHPSGNSDIALIELNEEIESATPVKFLGSITGFQHKFLNAVNPAKEGLLIGYGRREDGGQGLKYMVDAALRDFSAWESIAGNAGKDSCNGDSGGPSFVKNSDGMWIQYGLVSRSWTFECGKGGYLTNIAPHACWIEEKTGIKSEGTATQCQENDKIYSDLALSKIEFLSLCNGKRANRFQTETIDRLKIRFGTDNCQQLSEKLKAENLQLNDLLLRDLSPIAPFRQFTQLNLANNLIKDAFVLTRLDRLKLLDITANNIENPDESLAAIEIGGATILGAKTQLQNYSKTDFLFLCTKDDLNPETRKTIKAIFAKTVSEDCATANSRLLTIKNLNLSDRGLTDLTPLAGLPKLQVLDISKNPVIDASPLSDLELLKTLNVVDTQITDLTSLSKLIDRGLSIKQ